MLLRMLILSLGLFFANSLWSFTCYFTVLKDNCWTKYDVSIDVIDNLTEKKLTTVKVPAGTSWVRDTFECTAAQTLIYKAQFSPIFWQNDEGKVFSGLRSWSLPQVIHPNDKAWTINLCYSADFSGVPLPPTANGKCMCDFSSIPAVKVK